jgi:hypothetical protein
LVKPNKVIIFAASNNKVKNYYMDANGIISLISNVGFPVAVCVALFYYMEKQNERHQNETDKLNETVQSNTKVLTELCTLIKTLIK